ncbi:solute carrier family 22 member 7 [Rhipicephalus microplus]|uniref:solute carrier family 22 member 7 n=1 Tax=Rhipicephalus microplus TaxID=6941 RepID=UPI003F6A6E47
MTSTAAKSGSRQSSPARSILAGFSTTSDKQPFIQENVYILLGHGWFQRMVLICSVLSFTVLLLHAFAYRLIGRPVEHWCRPPKEFLGIPLQEWKNAAIPVLPDGEFSQCTVYEPPVPGEDAKERHVVPCRHWEYAGDRQRDSIISAWDLVCGRHWLYTLSASAYMVGAMVIVPLAGIASDRHGRRPTILLCSLTMLFGSVATALSQVFTMFLLARCLVAGASSATNLLVFIVLYEVTGNEHRALYGILSAGISTAWATPLLSVVALSDPRWWLSHAFLATATALAAAWCYSIQESPVWLIDTHQVRFAEHVILCAAAQNGIDLKKAKATFKAFKKQLEKRGSSVSTISTGTGASTATFRRRAASVFISWFGANFAFYGTGLREKTINSLWTLTALALQVLLVLVTYNFITKWGQRNALSMVLALLCLSSALRATIHALDMTFPWTAFASLIVDASASVAMAMNYCYTTDVFPTTIRSMGLCVSYAVGRAGALLATFLDTLTAGNLIIFDLVMTLIVLVSGMAIQWLPEIFVHKKVRQPTQLVPDTEQQRKEALKASLDLGTEPIGTKRKARKSRRKATPSSASSGARSQCENLSSGSAPISYSETVASSRGVKHSKCNKSGETAEGALPLP